MKLAGAVGLAALAFLAMPAYAQSLDSFTSLSVDVTPPAAALQPGQAVTLNVTVTAGCALLAQTASAPSASLNFSNVPDNVTVTGGSVAFTVSACQVPAGTVNSDAATITVTPAATATGMESLSFDVTATMQGAQGPVSSAPETVLFQIAYKPCHELTTDIDFPYEVTTREVTFNVTVEFCGNARSMVMFDNADADNGGRVEGLAPKTEIPPKTITFPVKFIAPVTAWTTSNITFYNYSHFLPTEGVAGDPALHQNVTWAFTNGNPDGDPVEPEDSFSLPLPLIVATLVGVALVADKRRK